MKTRQPNRRHGTRRILAECGEWWPRCGFWSGCSLPPRRAWPRSSGTPRPPFQPTQRPSMPMMRPPRWRCSTRTAQLRWRRASLRGPGRPEGIPPGDRFRHARRIPHHTGPARRRQSGCLDIPVLVRVNLHRSPRGHESRQDQRFRHHGPARRAPVRRRAGLLPWLVGLLLVAGVALGAVFRLRRGHAAGLAQPASQGRMLATLRESRVKTNRR